MNRSEMMKIKTLPLDVLEDLPLRHKKIQSILQEKDIDACILTGNTNLCYAIGMVANAYFYLPREGEAFLFAHKSIPIEGSNVFSYSRLEDIPAILLKNEQELPLTIALEEDEISAREYHRLCKVFSPAQPVPNANVARLARMVKTPYEVSMIRRDGKRLADAYNHFADLYEEGMTDLEFSAAIEYSLRKNNHQGLFRTFGFRMEAHMGTVLCGENAGVPSPYDFSLGGAGLNPVLPIGPTGKIISRNESLMVDICGNFSGFMLDLSRTFAAGTLPVRAYDLHQISLEILDILETMGHSGIPCNELYNEAMSIVQKYDVEDCFMGLDKQAKFIGHGFGYEINELPIISERYVLPLETNMVIALEPKFILKGVGAVGAEESYIVKENGLDCITSDCPRQIISLF